MRGRCESAVSVATPSAFAVSRRTLLFVSARILLLADDPSLAAALRADGHDPISWTDSRLPELAVVDRIADIPRLRGGGLRVPFVVLLAADEAHRMVDAFEAGADDVVAQPASPREVAARVDAILRRTRARAAARSEILHAGELELDGARHEVRLAGRPIELTSTEFRLLRYFMMNPRRVMTRAQILHAVWEDDVARRSNAVETYVGYLRRKLEPEGARLIRTVRQIGYVLEV